MAVSIGMPDGGVTCSVSVRLRSTRLISLGPAVRSSVTSSPSVTISPLGEASGVAMSCSGFSQRSPRRITSRRFSPSKYSPRKAPLPIARIMVATSPRVQPSSAIRRSSGFMRSSGSASSRLGWGRTLAPGISSEMISYPTRPASSRPSNSPA